MKHTWADPSKEWNGFHLTSYTLDLEKISALPLTQEIHTDGKTEKIATTVGNVYKKFADHCVKVDDGLETEITTDTEEASFGGPSFSRGMLNELLKLRKEGLEPSYAEWFYYDKDSCTDDPHESYSFFVVCHDKLVRERVSFSDYHGSGFDPSVFEMNDGSDSVWRNDDAWCDARIRFWYQKFYAEIRTGQLMLLRSDEPEIHGRQKSPSLLSVNAINALIGIRRLLWILIVLVLLVLVRLWK